MASPTNWPDVHDMKTRRLVTLIDLSINQNIRVLLILSPNSIKSDLVEHEFRAARELEKNLGRDVLCPVALNENWRRRILEANNNLAKNGMRVLGLGFYQSDTADPVERDLIFIGMVGMIDLLGQKLKMLSRKPKRQVSAL